MFYSILSNFSYLAISYFQTQFIYNYIQIDSNYMNNNLCKIFLSALSGYTTISLLGLLIDINFYYKPELLSRFKIQPKKLSIKEYINSASLSLFNLIFVSPAVTIPLYNIFNKDQSYNYTKLFLSKEILCFVCCILFVEFWFYFTHRLLHTRFLYKNIHKFHHIYKYPVSSACMFAHPVEFIFGNLLGVILGPFLLNCHIYTICMWVCFALMSTGGSHSGYYILGGEEHDLHHKYNKYNYGTIGILDKIFNTNFIS